MAKPFTAHVTLLALLFLATVPPATMASERIIECRTLPEPASGACDFTPGEGRLLIRADLLAPAGVLINGELLIGDDGRISCSACDCSETPGYAEARTLSCPGSTVSPGLIDSEQSGRFADNPPAVAAFGPIWYKLSYRQGS